jgi:predicted ribonuclease YlaK
LLPDELQNKSGDNYILAVAYAYKDKNPVILSNDNNLQVKAQMLEIPVMNLVAYRESIKQIIKK